MITDLKQPAHHWLADHIENFGVLLREGADPACKIETAEGVEIEIRLNRAPGLFERVEIQCPPAPPSGSHTEG